MRDKAARTPGGSVVALRASDGSVLWRHSTFQFAGFVANAGADEAYLRDATARITALRIRNGIPLWGKDTRARNWVIATSNLVYVATRDGDITVLHASSGASLWHTHLRIEVSDAPLIGEGSIFVPTADGGMSVLDATTGALRWSAEGRPLAIAQGLVYSLTSDGRMSVLRVSDGTFLRGYEDIESVLEADLGGKLLAVTSTGNLVALQAQTGSPLWRWQSPAPIVLLNPAGSTLVYITTQSQDVIALRISDGSLYWKVGAALQR